MYKITKFGITFNSSNFTVIQARAQVSSDVLFALCAESIITLNKDSIFIDGNNTFNPYSLAKIAKSFGIKQENLLSRVHVARAFTEYQMEELVNRTTDAINRWKSALLSISCMASLFNNDEKELFEKLIKHIISITKSLDIITVVSSSKELELNNIMKKNADLIIDID
jgi:hypothetical protein